MDSDFATCKDYLFAEFIAHEKTIAYLEEEFIKLKISKKRRFKSLQEVLRDSSIDWTESKISMVELVYGLAYSGAVNNGNVDIIELSDALSTLFHIDNLDVYRSFIDLKYRKKNAVVFLDKMRKNLLDKLGED